MCERLFSRKNARGSKSVLTSQQLIQLQAKTIERSLPPIVVRHHERQIVHNVRSVLQKQTALLERLHDEANIALLQITHAAMRQLGAAARRAFAKVALLQQQHIVAPRSRIDRNPNAGRAPADDNHVPGFGMRLDAPPHIGTIHSFVDSTQLAPSNRKTASPPCSKSDKAARESLHPSSAPTVDRLPS